MTADAWLVIAAFVGFLAFWIFILPRTGMG